MTDEQMEAFAKNVCKLAGRDPFELVNANSPISNFNGATCLVLAKEPRWRSVAKSLKDNSLFKDITIESVDEQKSS